MLTIRLVSLSASLFTFFSLAGASSLGHGSPVVQRHHEIARRAEGDIELFRRVSGARMTFYNVQTGNPGSCGQVLQNSQMVVAMNQAQMNPSWCFKSIRITFRGISRIATIQDTCPGCPWGGLDLSEGLFTNFLPQSSGVFAGDWEFVDGSGGNDNPTPTTTKKRTTTSIWHPPTTTSTRTTSKTSSVVHTTFSTSAHSSGTKTSSSVSSASSSVDYLSGVASGLAIPTGIIDIPAGATDSVLQDLNQIFVEIGALAMTGANV